MNSEENAPYLDEACSPAEFRVIERFIGYEAKLLNQCRFKQWYELFSEDGSYWVPAIPNQENPEDTISIIYEDKLLLAVRIERLQQGRAHSQTPMPQTIRLISNIEVVAINSQRSEYQVVSNFVFLEYRDGTSRFFGGELEHLLREDAGKFYIVRKRVNLINCEDSHEFMSMPF
jgi:3-phenylpropionate/cinnamic acid dioxygenase small subunit